MNRCLDCNALLTKDEKVCMECGSRAPEDKRSSTNPVSLMVNVVTLAFYASVALLIASPFLEKGPGFVMSMLLTCALLFLMRSVKEIVAKPQKR
ncbi:MAG: hypothetical protein ACRD96_02930 [Bryobacteraceae bacterium]